MVICDVALYESGLSGWFFDRYGGSVIMWSIEGFKYCCRLFWTADWYWLYDDADDGESWYGWFIGGNTGYGFSEFAYKHKKIENKK